MHILVSKVPRTLIEQVGAEVYADLLGLLVTPRSRTLQVPDVLAVGGVWAADNDCFQRLDKRAYVSMLKAIAPYAETCRFVAAPDVPYHADQTLTRFRLWQPVLRYYGLPVALVAQNGIEATTIPWDDCDALFIGGDDAFKEGHIVRDLMAEAKQRGKWVHVGRVNTRRRLHLTLWRGADSIDGTSYARWSKTNLPAAIREIQYQRSRQTDNLPLWEGRT
jgi:hypothetical protein